MNDRTAAPASREYYHRMKVLVIGGTQFLGIHTVQSALDRGHEVTTFNRGTRRGLVPGVEGLHGDRDGGLGSLGGRTWDAVIDVPGYLPRVVHQSAQLLADAVDRYVFVSSISVYPEFPVPGMDETAAVAKIDDETNEDVSANYGALKVLCEREVERAFLGRSLVIRPGLIVGPHDPTGRFTYWPVRAHRGGEILAPDSPAVPLQLIDARDLGDWTIRMLERRATGVFNATGPAEPLTMGEFLETAMAVCNPNTSLTWVPEAALLEQKVVPWSDLPLWLPSSGANMLRVGITRALDAGLTFRPLAETVRDTLSWALAQPPGQPSVGLSPERERDLLAAWKSP